MTEQGPRALEFYGGQAVIEGVMMRGRVSCTVAVRAPSGAIELKDFTLGSLYRSRISRLPFLRGLVILWDALGLGMRALTYSANVQTEEEEEKIEGAGLLLTILSSLAVAIGLFFLIPAGLAFFIERGLDWTPWWANVAEGLVRLALLVGYIWAIGRLPEIERVFGYHGAEHKTINAFEAGAPLRVESVQSYSREHPRCGTAFLLTVVVFSVLLFAALGPLDLLPRLLSRLLLIPVLASLAYEYLRFTARIADRPWAWPLIAPNLYLQRLTTREPEPAMIEVALRAFEAMRTAEREDTSETARLVA